MPVMDLDRLEVWTRAKESAVTVYHDVIPCLPDTEKWNLAQQLRRAAQSIPANIAEGHGRYHFLDNVRFCYVARGSLAEVQSHLSLAYSLGYLPAEIHDSMTRRAEALGRQLNAYIASLKRMKKGSDLPPSDHILQEASADYLESNDSDEP